MFNRIPTVLAAAVLVALAGFALAQNADQNTGGPTKNTLRMTIVEPTEGSHIIGTDVRVVVAYNRDAFGTTAGTKFGTPDFPQPRFDVYLDNAMKTTLKGTEANVAHLENVPAGTHKMTVVALNVSGEIIDRKEITFETSTTAMPAVVPAAEPVPQAPPAPAYEPPPAAPAAPVEQPNVLPKTASRAPAFALTGFALVAGGLLVARKRR